MRSKSYASLVSGLRAGLIARLLAGLMAGLAFTACTLMAPQAPAAELPDDYLPTAIALTIQAVMPDLPATPPSPGEGSPLPPTPDDVLEPTSMPEAQTPLENPPESLDPPAAEVNLPASTPKPASAAIQILSPGPASKVTSPIRLNAFLAPGDKGNVRIELLGEDGRLLVRQLLSYGPLARIQVVTELDFEISATGELGRLRITTEDPEGRMVAVASVDLLLISWANPTSPLPQIRSTGSSSRTRGQRPSCREAT
jgi:hypothetical protein